jgi:hypothetical protein
VTAGRAIAGAASLLFASTSAASIARAQPVDVPVEVHGCDAVDAMVSAVRVELASTTQPLAKVTVLCLRDARVLVVAFPVGTDAVAREVDVRDTAPEAHARSVAIAAGEMLRGSTSSTGAPMVPASPANAPTPASAPTPAPIVVQIASPAPVEEARAIEAPFPWTVGASLNHRFFTSSASTSLSGPALELEVPLGRLPLRLLVGTELAHGVASDASGEASLWAWTGSVGLAAHVDQGPLLFGFGPFLEAGGAFVDGAAAPPGADASGSAPLALLGARVTLGAHLDGVWVPHVGLDAGGVVAGVDADVDDRALLSLAGSFVGVRLGIAVAPSGGRPASVPGRR